MPPTKAKWTAGKPTVSVNSSGTLTASVPVLDSGTLAATLQFVLTADRALTVTCVNQPGSAGLQGFSAWSQEG